MGYAAEAAERYLYGGGECGRRSVADSVGDGLHIPDQSHLLQEQEAVIGEVDFPPEKSLPGGGRVMVMVVVPSLSKRDERQPEIIAALIARLIALPPEHMGQGVDGKSGMCQHNGGDEKAPDEHLGSARAQLRGHAVERSPEREHHGAQRHRHKHVETVQEPEFGEFGQVGNRLEVRSEVGRVGDPPQVTPPESMLHRGMNVFFGVRVHMVLAVIGRPPERASLHGRIADQGQDKLHRSGRLEGLVREIAMVKAGETPDEDSAKLNLATKTIETKIDRFLSNSFGFGGTNSSLIIGKYF